jgi:hypothetical protein
MALNEYDIGDVASVTAVFRVAGVPTDPTVVTAEVRKPSGLDTYVVAAGEITTAAAGVYNLNIVVDEPGDWWYRFVGTGAATGAQEGGFRVRPEMALGAILDPGALTTLSRARAWVLRNVTTNEQDELLALLINAASAATVNFVEREFKPADSETRTLNYDGDGVCSLSPWEIRSVDEITIVADGQTVAQTLTDRFYKLEPAQRTPEGTYLNLRFADASWWPMLAANQSYWRYPMFDGGYQITVTGDWGMETVPADVEMAVLVTVDDGFRNPGSVTSFAQGGGFVAGEPLTGGSTGSLPIGARRLLLPYKRSRRVGSIRLSPRSGSWSRAF